MNKSDKNSRKQIEILKAQLAENRVKNKTKFVSKKVDTSGYTELSIDPKFYKKSLIRTINITLVIISLLLLLYSFQDKWMGYINLNF